MSTLLGFLQPAPCVHGVVRKSVSSRCHRVFQANAEGLLDRPVARQRVQPLISIDQLMGSTAGDDKLSVKPVDQKLELSVLIDVLPVRIKELLQDHRDLGQLVEVVLDLGRPVLARFAETDELLSTKPLTRHELEEVTAKVTP